MAEKIQHNGQAQVKDEQSKAALVALLNRTYDQINDLQGQLDALTERIDPAPAPLPETIDPNILWTKLQLREQKQAVNAAGEAFGRTVEEFRQAARRLRLQLPSGRNARAWKELLGMLDEEARLHIEAVDAALSGLMWHTSTVAALVTFAQADNLPESIGEEAGNARGNQQCGTATGTHNQEPAHGGGCGQCVCCPVGRLSGLPLPCRDLRHD